MSLETGSFINDLAPSNPLGSDPAGQGDDHLRLIKGTVQATLPNMGAQLGRVRSQDTSVSISSIWNTNHFLVTASSTSTVVLTLPPQASITSGFYVDLTTLTGANISLFPSAGGTVNGAASFTIPEQSSARAFFTGGAAWRCNTSPNGNSGVVFANNVTMKGSLTVSGTAVLSNGQLKFPATQNASADVNALDDYCEGMWTPTLTFATPGNQNIAYSIRNGVFTKIGNLVYISAEIVTSTFTHTTSSGFLNLTGLPYPSATRASLSIGAISGIKTTGTQGMAAARIPIGYPQQVQLGLIDIGAGTSSDVAASNHVSGTNVTLYISGTYGV